MLTIGRSTRRYASVLPAMVVGISKSEVSRETIDRGGDAGSGGPGPSGDLRCRKGG